MDRIDIIPGKRKNSILFFYKGFKYLQDKSCKKVARCSTRMSGCKATLHFVKDINDIEVSEFKKLDENIDFFIKKTHNDIADENENIWIQMKQVMITKAKESNENLINIFNDVSNV